MPSHPSRPLLLALLSLACAALVAACAAPRTTGDAPSPGPPAGDDDAASDPPPVVDPVPTPMQADADAATVSVAPSDDAGQEATNDEGAPPVDAEGGDDAPEVGLPDVSVPPFDAGEGGLCAGPPGPGDLVIDELMIASVAGSGDHGEWLEIKSNLGCALDLRGVRGNAPSGSRVSTFAISDDLWIPAYGTFVIADSSLAAINHTLPGTVVVWTGQPGDVLRNLGATITLQYEDVLVDTLTYPSMTLVDGASFAFPSDCAPAQRTDWTRWQLSSASWFPGFHGTPNAPNDDVRCP